MAYKGMVDGSDHPKAAEMVNSIPGIFRQEWMQGLFLDPSEERFVNASFGTLHPRQRAEASWLTEGMAVLAWALELADLPPFYQIVKGAEVSKALGIFQRDASERIERAMLRNPDEIILGASIYGALMWRLNEYLRERKPLEFRKKLIDQGSHQVVAGLEFMEEDLAIEGSPLNKVPDEKLSSIGGIIYQRNRRFRWLLGFERGESTVTTVN